MIVVMHKEATKEQVERVVHQIEALNFKAHLSEGETATVIGVIGPNAIEIKDSLVHLGGVAQMLVDVSEAVERGRLVVFVAELLGEGDGPLAVAQCLRVSAELGQLHPGQQLDGIERLFQLGIAGLGVVQNDE